MFRRVTLLHRSKLVRQNVAASLRLQFIFANNLHCCVAILKYYPAKSSGSQAQPDLSDQKFSLFFETLNLV
jgi:hypothetical protein